MRTPVIQITDVSKRFIIRKEKSLKERLVNRGRSQEFKEDFWALKDVNLEIASGSTVGLVGPNGSGKSTLLKMVGGILQPTTGSVNLRGRIAALLELGAGFHGDLTGRENVYLNASILGISKEQTDKYFDAIVDFSGIEDFIDTQVKFYSSGMYVRLAFAVAVHVDPDILLVDEVLAVGDEPFQHKCMDRIRRFQAEGRTIVFVSHSLDQVADLCDRAVVLREGRVISDGQPVDSLQALRDEFDLRRAADLEAAQAAEEASAIELASKGPTSPTAPQIVKVEVTDRPGGNPVTSIGQQADVTVSVTIKGVIEDDEMLCGFGIDNANGARTFGSGTEHWGGVIPRSFGGFTRVDFRIPDLRLGVGSYTVVSSLATGERRTVSFGRCLTPLRVTGTGQTNGSTWAEVEVDVASNVTAPA